MRSPLALILALACLCPVPSLARPHWTIPTLGFRPVAEDDPLLGPRAGDREAFYSIRPPADWKVGPFRGTKALPYGTFFREASTGDCLSVGLLEGGPSELTLPALSRFRGDYLASIRKSGLGALVGSDLYAFGHYDCLQVMVKDEKTLTLQLLVFDHPGDFLLLSYTMSASHYHALARALEASIASLQWPVLSGK